MVISVSSRVYPLRYTQSVVNFTSKKEEDNSQRVPTVATSTIKAVPLALVMATMPNMSIADDKSPVEPYVILAETVASDEISADTYVYNNAMVPLSLVSGSNSGENNNSMKITVPKEYKYDVDEMYQFPFNPAFQVVGKAEFKENGMELYYLSSDNNLDDAEHLALLIPSEKGTYYILDLTKIGGNRAYSYLYAFGEWINIKITDDAIQVLESGNGAFKINKDFALSLRDITGKNSPNGLPYNVYGSEPRLIYSGD